MVTTKAKIYKSEQRGVSKSEVFSRYSIFNFDGQKSDATLPFGILEAVNDETLCPGNKVMRHVEQFMDIVIIPLSGTIVYKDSLGNEAIVETEQVGIFSVQEGMVYELVNHFEQSHVNYLQIWLRANDGQFRRQSKYRDFNQPEMNALFPIFCGLNFDHPVLKTNAPAFGHIGVFNEGRSGKYTLKNKKNGLFAFVINGSFDFEGRQLQSRDAISLSGSTFAGFQSTVDNAALLLLEIPIED